MDYVRLTKRGGYSSDLDLTQEPGYSLIYHRLSELEDKIESKELKWQRKARFKVGEEVFYVRFTPTGEHEIVRVPVKKVYIGETVISYGLEVGRCGWVCMIRDSSKNLCATAQEAQERLAEIKRRKEEIGNV